MTRLLGESETPGSFLSPAGFSLPRGPREAGGGAEPGGGGRGAVPGGRAFQSHRLSVPGAQSRVPAATASSSEEPGTFWGEIPVWGPPPAARAGAWGLGAVSVPGTFRRSGAFWLRRWPRVLKAALRGSQVSGAVGVVRGAPVLVPPSAPPTPPALFFVSPFHHFCTSRFSFFQPLRSRRLRAILGLWEAPQETGFCPVVGPALLKARLRRRQKCGVRGDGSQPWPGAFATLSPSRVSPSVTRRNSLCLQKPDEKGLCKVSFQALSSPLSASLLSTWLFRLLALLHLGPLYKFLAGTDCLSRPVSEPTSALGRSLALATVY